MTHNQLIEIVKARYQASQSVSEFLVLVLFSGESFEKEEQVIDYLERLEVLGEYIKL